MGLVSLGTSGMPERPQILAETESAARVRCLLPIEVTETLHKLRVFYARYSVGVETRQARQGSQDKDYLC